MYLIITPERVVTFLYKFYCWVHDNNKKMFYMKQKCVCCIFLAKIAKMQKKYMTGFIILLISNKFGLLKLKDTVCHLLSFENQMSRKRSSKEGEKRKHFCPVKRTLCFSLVQRNGINARGNIKK